MPAAIKLARPKRRPPAKAQLTPYEAQQIQAIAAWKSKPPNGFAELYKRFSLAGAQIVKKVIPDRLVAVTIEKCYDVAERLARRDNSSREAGVKNLTELRKKPLEVCDHLAAQVSDGSQILATAEGAVTGVGGLFTTFIDVPALFIVALRTILKIGHCYGYPLDTPRDRNFVLGVLIAALSGTLETRRRRLETLHEIEDLLIEETQEEIVGEEILSVLFQLEVFADIPGIGAISGALLNLAFIRRVDRTAQHVFQERWLRDNGKVHRIEPAVVDARHVAAGWTGAFARAAHSGCYCLGFGATLPVYLAASLLPALDNPLTRGLRDGADAAEADADHLLAWARDQAPAAPRRARRAAALA
jgi:hypothetical protein